MEIKRPRLFTCQAVTNVISFFKEFYDAWISGIYRSKFTKRGTRVEQPSVLNKFFSELQYSAVFGRESRKFVGKTTLKVLYPFLPCSGVRAESLSVRLH